MSQTITIPSDRGSIVTVSVNGRDYSYKAGQTVSVPDEVAALFASNEREAVEFGRRATAPLEAPKRKGGASGAPVMTDDNGNMYADAHGVAKAALDEIYVDGHKLVIPNEE